MNPIPLSFLGLFGYESDEHTPVRLAKKVVEPSITEKITLWWIRNYYLIITLLIILGLILFVLACYKITPPVESGVYHNHLNDIIQG